jgi:DNA-binding CsgD family transcriptional regulator
MLNTVVYPQGQLTHSLPSSRLLKSSAQDSDHKNRNSGELPVLLQSVMESLIDGIMLLNEQGELLFANACAKRICHRLTQNISQNISQSITRHNLVPRQILRSCQALVKGRQEFPQQSVIIEDEIKTEETGAIRIRAQWLTLNTVGCPCLLVTLEDRQQSAQHKAIAEAQKYGLTERETQVWLLRQAGYTYKAIALELHIADDTVKKHIKSIHTKRDGAEWLEEE